MKTNKLILVLGSIFFLSACNGVSTVKDTNNKDVVESSSHTHMYSYETVQGTTIAHNKKCLTCGDVTTCNSALSGFTLQSEVLPNCDTDGHRSYVCNDCGYTYVEKLNKIGHSAQSAWQHDSINHWHNCSHTDCTERLNVASHTWVKVNTSLGNSPAHNKKCNVCNREEACTGSFTVTSTPSTCTATGTVTYTCNDCGYQYQISTPAKQHNYVTTYTWNGFSSCQGKVTCSVCGQTLETENASITSTITEEGSCSIDKVVTYYANFTSASFGVQSKTQNLGKNHSYGQLHQAVAPKYNKEGHKAYYKCNICGKYFDQNRSETSYNNLKIAKYSTNGIIMDDLVNSSYKSPWDAVNNNIHEWQRNEYNPNVLHAFNKDGTVTAGYMLSSDEYTDIDVKFKVEGVGTINPYPTYAWNIKKAICIGAYNPNAFDKMPRGYYLSLYDNLNGDHWLQLAYYDDRVDSNVATFLAGYPISPHAVPFELKIRDKFLSIYTIDGRILPMVTPVDLRKTTDGVYLDKYEGGHFGIYQWTGDPMECQTTFEIYDFSGIKKSEVSTYNKIKSQTNGPKVNVFLMAGQSNMEGNTRAIETWDTNKGKTYLADYYKSQGWDFNRVKYGFNNVQISYHCKYPESYDAPNTYSGDAMEPGFTSVKLGQGLFPNTHIGPEIGLAEKLSTDSRTSYLIKYAAGGTEFNYTDVCWKSPSAGGHGLLYYNLVRYAKACLYEIQEMGYTPVLKGFLWMQGESDSGSLESSNAYQNNLSCLISDVRNELKDFAINGDGNEINFIDAKIYALTDHWLYHNVINTAKTNIANSSPHNFIVNDSASFPINGAGAGGGDEHHYDVDGAVGLGKCFGQIILDNHMLDL